MKLRSEKEESDVQTIDPALATALVALRIAAPIVHPDSSTRQFTWRPLPHRERRLRP